MRRVEIIYVENESWEYNIEYVCCLFVYKVNISLLRLLCKVV